LPPSSGGDLFSSTRSGPAAGEETEWGFDKIAEGVQFGHESWAGGRVECGSDGGEAEDGSEGSYFLGQATRLDTTESGFEFDNAHGGVWGEGKRVWDGYRFEEEEVDGSQGERWDEGMRLLLDDLEGMEGQHVEDVLGGGAGLGVRWDDGLVFV
jgi:hypothetical protein